MNVNELITELEDYKKRGWGECKVSVFDEVYSRYLPVKQIQGYCGVVLIFKSNEA